MHRIIKRYTVQKTNKQTNREREGEKGEREWEKGEREKEKGETRRWSEENLRLKITSHSKGKVVQK